MRKPSRINRRGLRGIVVYLSEYNEHRVYRELCSNGQIEGFIVYFRVVVDLSHIAT